MTDDVTASAVSMWGHLPRLIDGVVSEIKSQICDLKSHWTCEFLVILLPQLWHGTMQAFTMSTDFSYFKLHCFNIPGKMLFGGERAVSRTPWAYQRPKCVKLMYCSLMGHMISSHLSHNIQNVAEVKQPTRLIYRIAWLQVLVKVRWNLVSVIKNCCKFILTASISSKCHILCLYH